MIDQRLTTILAVLEEAGFGARAASTPDGRTMIIAENASAAVGVMEFTDESDLGAAEHQGVSVLASPETFSAPRKWDTYLVLTCAHAAADGARSEAEVAVTYDTKYVRRIVKWEVGLSRENIENALLPFMPLPRQGGMTQLDPVVELAAALVRNGVSPDDTDEAISLWSLA